MAIHSDDIYADKKEQLEKVEDFCLDSEIIRAVFDLKGVSTGFLAITDKRLIFTTRNFSKNRRLSSACPIHA